MGIHKGRITLQVGERRFTTYRNTLIKKSIYFAARLGHRRTGYIANDVDIDRDGSYFIDADPAIFEHILNHMRSGDYPLFFDAGTLTIDYAKYISLLGQAQHFGLRDLKTWIEKEMYLDVVRLRKRQRIITDDFATGEWMDGSNASINTKTNTFPSWNAMKVYICPLGIDEHNGIRDLCDSDCEEKRRATTTGWRSKI
ncbi:hypothetical protein F4781DRAFT_433021 [Annulohypoxylon bovei var. microspora]|nr:hypothetical protein F4781DRAFT_433021 [Annulohypoxylon bovei var. microspora]